MVAMLLTIAGLFVLAATAVVLFVLAVDESDTSGEDGESGSAVASEETFPDDSRDDSPTAEPTARTGGSAAPSRKSSLQSPAQRISPPGFLQTKLLTKSDLGQTWNAGDPDTPSDEAFCGKPLAYNGGSRGTATFVREEPAAIVLQHAYGGVPGQAAKSLAAVRASGRSCTSWSDTEGQATVTYAFKPVQGRTRLGDDSAVYQIKATGTEVPFNAVQIYVVKGDVLSILTYGVTTDITSADIKAAEGYARRGADRLATAP